MNEQDKQNYKETFHATVKRMQGDVENLRYHLSCMIFLHEDPSVHITNIETSLEKIQESIKVLKAQLKEKGNK